MTEVCGEGQVHRIPNTSDLDGIRMRMRGEPIESVIFSIEFVEREVVKEAHCFGAWSFSKGLVGMRVIGMK